MMTNWVVISNELYHHGIKGQKWGIRRFQNEDGSLTAKGQKRYGEEGVNSKKYKRDISLAKHKEQQKNAKERYLKDRSGLKKGIQSRAFDVGHNKSVGRIVASGVLKVMGATAVTTAASMVTAKKMTDNGNYIGAAAASHAINAIGGLSIAAITATHVTAAVQRGRGKI